MSEQPSTGQLDLFLGDLRAIRLKRDVSIETLRDITKVYPEVIAQFELDGLVDHDLFNSLYVRAFIRSYAKAVGIPAETVLQSYDQALDGLYERQLALEYLDLPPAEVKAIRENQKKEEKAEPVFAADKFEFDRKQKEEPYTAGASVTFVPKPKAEEKSSKLVSGIKEKTQSFFESGKQSAIVQWGLLASGIGLGLFVILQLLSFQPDDGSSEPHSQVSVTPQTLENETPAELPDSIAAMPAQQLEVPAPVVPVILGDSIPLYVVAATGKLDPFRLKKDRDLRRPYWLDEGDSMLFYMENRITVEDNLDALQILIEGRSYPIYATDSLATVIITRDSIQAFLERR